MTERPVGYWVKEVDRLLDSSLDGTLAGDGLSRRHWQALNVLASGPVSVDGLAQALAPFWSADAPAAAEVLAELDARGWTARAGDGPDGTWALGAAGRDALDRLGAAVGAVRRRTVDGISPEAYTITLETLRRMAANLTADAPAESP